MLVRCVRSKKPCAHCALVCGGRELGWGACLQGGVMWYLAWTALFISEWCAGDAYENTGGAQQGCSKATTSAIYDTVWVPQRFATSEGGAERIDESMSIILTN